MSAYRSRIAERFCWDAMVPTPVDVWVHAVSFGEVVAVTPFIEALLTKGWRVLVTCMTPTGSARIQQQFGSRVLHRYLPYEQPHALKRFFANYRPRVGIILETELWPNLIHYARAARVHLLLFNACLSLKSARGYRRFSWIFAPILNQFSGIYTQTDLDAERFCTIGALPEIVQVTGNLKFDLQIKEIDLTPFNDFRRLWGMERVVFMLASTHDNEEQQILRQLRRIQQLVPNVLVLIAPRHPERFLKVSKLARDMGFITSLRSEPNTILPQSEVIILDSMGELLGFYHVSDYAFVGGSLVPVHGHNILEPIAMGTLVMVGPYIENIQSICDELLAVHGLVQVETAEALSKLLQQFNEKPAEKKKIQLAAKRTLEKNRGALQRYVSITEKYRDR